MAKAPALTGVAAALAQVDQRTAELADAERLATEAATDAEALAGQIRAFEVRVQQGDPTADAGQLVELEGLHRFAALQSQAANKRFVAATDQLAAAQARVVTARIADHAALSEPEFTSTFWAAAEVLARLRQLDKARGELAVAFAEQRQVAREALVKVGDSEGMAALDALPDFDLNFYRQRSVSVFREFDVLSDSGLFVSLALDEAFPGDDGYRFREKVAHRAHARVQLDAVPSLANSRPEAGK